MRAVCWSSHSSQWRVATEPSLGVPLAFRRWRAEIQHLLIQQTSPSEGSALCPKHLRVTELPNRQPCSFIPATDEGGQHVNIQVCLPLGRGQQVLVWTLWAAHAFKLLESQKPWWNIKRTKHIKQKRGGTRCVVKHSHEPAALKSTQQSLLKRQTHFVDCLLSPAVCLMLTFFGFFFFFYNFFF